MPLENLTEEETLSASDGGTEVAIDEESMRVRSVDSQKPWVDYVVTSKQSGRTYRVALRGMEPGESFCTCPDFRGNYLGTCKHILNVQAKVKKRFSAKKLKQPYRRKRLSVRIDYRGSSRGVLFNLPVKPDAKVVEIVGNADQQPLLDPKDVMTRIQALEEAGHHVTIFPDVEEFVRRKLVHAQVHRECEAIRKDQPTIRFETNCSTPSCFPTNWMESRLRLALGVQFWRTIWGWERPSKPSALRNCFLGLPIFNVCWLCVPHR